MNDEDPHKHIKEFNLVCFSMKPTRVQLGMPDPFFVDIVAVFPGNGWQTNVVNNSVTFQGTKNSTITFLFAPNAPIVIEGQIGVTFYLPPIVQVNPMHNLFLPPVSKPVYEGETINK